MRKYYLDNIRWMTVVLVVIYHVFYMYNAVGIPGVFGKITGLGVQYCDLYMYIVYPWFMMLLFIVSGTCSRYFLERHSDREFIKSRTTKLLVPSTIGLFAFHFIQGYVNMSLSGAFDSLKEVPTVIKALIMVVSGIGPLWYIQVLWILSLVLVPIRKLEKDRLWTLCGNAGIPLLVLLVIPVWGAAQILNTPIIVVYRFGLYGMAFLLGYFVFSHDAVIEKLKEAFVPFLLIAVGLGIAFCRLYFGQNYADVPINRSPLFVGYGWFACLAIFGGMAKYGDFENSFTRWMGKRSFGLYVFHYLGISTAALLFAKPGKLPASVVYVLSLIAGFAAGYGFNAVISRLPFFRWAVLGIKKDKANV